MYMRLHIFTLPYNHTRTSTYVYRTNLRNAERWRAMSIDADTKSTVRYLELVIFFSHKDEGESEYSIERTPKSTANAKLWRNKNR